MNSEQFGILSLFGFVFMAAEWTLKMSFLYFAIQALRKYLGI